MLHTLDYPVVFIWTILWFWGGLRGDMILLVHGPLRATFSLLSLLGHKPWMMVWWLTWLLSNVDPSKHEMHLAEYMCVIFWIGYLNHHSQCTLGIVIETLLTSNTIVDLDVCWTSIVGHSLMFVCATSDACYVEYVCVGHSIPFVKNNRATSRASPIQMGFDYSKE